MKKSYWELDCLKNVYLEDSFVLGIEPDTDELVFDVEFVLKPEHPAYRQPASGERYCYRRGELSFEYSQSIDLARSDARPAVDASGDTDLGNIDEFKFDESCFYLGGDWGHATVCGGEVFVRLY